MFRSTATDRKYEAARHRQMTEERTMLKVHGEWERKPNIPSVDLKLCEYDKSRKVLKLTSEHVGMPSTFFVKSHHTGKEVRFVTVGSEDVLFDQDGWDGEQQIYRPLGTVPGVDHMVIYNQ